jgi:RNA polymerase sigma-70 factor (ECF subfamily)
MRVVVEKKVTGAWTEREWRLRHPMTMNSPAAPSSAPPEGPAAALPDRDLIARVRAGERGLFEILMRRHNQRLYRTARAIVQDEVEVEDVLQQAYLNAFAHLDQFEARSQLSTWLTRIVINEAAARRRSSQYGPATRDGESSAALATLASADPSPEHQAYACELQRLLEAAVDSLPERYRLVFMLRDVEGLSTSETGLGLGLGDEVVKTRLHRARAMIRRVVTERFGPVVAGAFRFHAPRCDRVVAKVLTAIDATAPAPPVAGTDS